MSDREDLQAIHGLIDDARSVLTVQSAQGIYPYAIANNKRLRLGQASMSTNAMVCYTIAALEGLLPHACAAVSRERIGADAHPSGALRECLARGLGAIIGNIGDGPVAALFRRLKPGDGADRWGPYDSGTFGRQDPFTLTWTVELLRIACARQGLADQEAARHALEAAEQTARQRVRTALAAPDVPVLLPVRSDERAVLHPLPLLRIVQLGKLLAIDDEKPLADAANWFSVLFHTQLSQRSIEHAMFDPALLVFALEGMIETSPWRVTRPMLSSFLSCLESARLIDPTLRSITPFKATESGAVHLFVGVEVFTALLRIARAREQAGDLAFFVEIKPIMHSYLQWLQATVVTGKAAPGTGSDTDGYPAGTPLDYLGWESEYAHVGDLSIHVWLTSQVILLLHGYETLLAASVARAELARVGLTVQHPADRSPRGSGDLPARARRDDPIQLRADSPYRVVSRLAESLVTPRLDGTMTGAAYSCLLYGPPGTGKTTLARRIARELGWPLLPVTTGDFIVDGEAQVEARAKEIFAALAAQRNVVVFFDEIDQLLLDRDTRDYKLHGDMLQFMTPSMLTKINDLRHSERAIIVIATNYAERIDHAVKGRGRVDQRLLVLPPDLTRREAIIARALGESGDARSGDKALISQAARLAAGFTSAEVETAVAEAARKNTDLVGAMKSVVPEISLDTYLARLAATDEDGGQIRPPELLEEAFLLTYLLTEGQDGPAQDGKYEALGNRWWASGHSIVRDEDVVSALDRVFS